MSAAALGAPSFGSSKLTQLEEVAGFSRVASWGIYLTLIGLLWFWAQYLAYLLWINGSYFITWALFGLIGPMIALNGMIIISGFCISKMALAKVIVAAPMSLATGIVCSILFAVMSLIDYAGLALFVFSILNTAIFARFGVVNVIDGWKHRKDVPLGPIELKAQKRAAKEKAERDAEQTKKAK